MAKPLFTLFHNPEEIKTSFFLPLPKGEISEEDVLFDDSLLTLEDFDIRLAKMAFALALSAFSSKKSVSEQGERVETFLKNAHFKKVRLSPDYEKESSPVGTGFAFGTKKLFIDGKKVNVVAIAIRGGNYGAEWASNAMVGEHGDHAGFHQAMEKVLSALHIYLKESHIRGEVLFFVTGYSRGAAIANLLSGKLLSAPFYKVSHVAVKAYCFACPLCAGKKKEGTIYNILSLNDPVPNLIPPSFSLTRNGEDILLKEKERYLALRKFSFHHFYDKNRLFESGGKILQKDFICELRTFLENALQRKDYVVTFQDGFYDELKKVDIFAQHPYQATFEGIKKHFVSLYDEYGFGGLLFRLLKRTDWEKIVTIEDLRAKNMVIGCMSLLALSLKGHRDELLTLIYQNNLDALLYAHQPCYYFEMLNNF